MNNSPLHGHAPHCVLTTLLVPLGLVLSARQEISSLRVGEINNGHATDLCEWETESLTRGTMRGRQTLR
jgi:hypothetical protein